MSGKILYLKLLFFSDLNSTLMLRMKRRLDSRILSVVKFLNSKCYICACKKKNKAQNTYFRTNFFAQSFVIEFWNTSGFSHIKLSKSIYSYIGWYINNVNEE